MPLFFKGDAVNARSYSVWVQNNGSILFSTTQSGSTNSNTQTAAGAIGLGAWTHVAAVVSRSTGQVRLLVNGVQVATGGVGTGPAIASTGPLLIGGTAEADASYSPLPGVVDEVRLWSVARSNADILATMNTAITGAAAGLALRLGLDETTGTMAADSAGQGADATLRRAGGITGRIDQPGERDSYSFSLTHETRLLIDALTHGDRLMLSLVGPRGTELLDLDFDEVDSSQHSGDRLLTLPPGTYTLTVRAKGDTTGWYNLRLLDLSQAVPVTLGADFTNNLFPASATQLFRFDAVAGQRIFLDRVAGSDDAHVRLYDPAGRMLFNRVAVASMRNLDVLTLASTGTYVLAVEGTFGGGHGAPMTLVVDSPVDVQASLALGATVQGQVTARGQVDRYTFTVDTPTRVVFDALSDTASLNWSLGTAGYQPVAERGWQNSDSENFTANPVITLPPGTYTLTVDAVGNARPSYAFRLLNLGSTTPIALDTVVEGTLNPGRETRLYSFSGTVRDRLWFDRTALSQDGTDIRLISPNGEEVFGPVDFVDSALFTLPMTGTYVLLVEGRRGDTAPISFGFALRKEAVPSTGGASSQNFDGAGLPYVLSNHGGRAAELVAGGPTGTFLRLAHASTGGTNNTVAFASTGEGTFASVAVAFDLRMIPRGPASRADGIGMALLPTRLYGDAGRVPAFAMEPNLPGALGVGFDIWNNNEVSNNHVSLHFNGVTLAANAIPLSTFDLANGQFFRAEVVAERVAGGSLVTVVLTPPGGGTPITVFDKRFVGGLDLLGARLAFGAMTGGEQADHDIDNITIATIAGATSAQPMALGSTVSGTIAQARGIYRHRFTLEAETAVLVDGLTADADVFWVLTGPDGQVASRSFSATDSWDGFDLLPLRLKPGSYEIAIGTTSATATPNYAFRLIPLGSATPLTPGVAVSNASVSPGNETDLYSFTANAGDRFFFDRLSGGGDIYWRLFDANGNLVSARNHVQSEFGPFGIAAAGTYYLAIEGRYYNTAAIGYGFTLHRVMDDAPDFAIGTPVSSSIAHPGQVDRYGFTLASRRMLYLDGFTNRNDIDFQLRGPGGVVIGPRDLNDSDMYWDGAAFLAAAGDWSLLVYGNADATGSYAFRLLDLSAATTITPGAPVSGTLNPHAGTDAYRFTGMAGQRLFLDAQLDPGNIYWRLLDQWGRTVLAPTDMADRVVTLPSAGEFFLLMEGVHGATGTANYRFNVQPITDSTTAAELGAPTTGSIAHAGQTARYAFTLDGARRILVDTLLNGVDAGWSDGQLRWTLTGPQGVVAERTWENGNGASFGAANPFLDLPQGTYTLAIRSTVDRTGSFSFRLIDVGTATPITPGTPVTGTLSPGSQARLYSFAATAGERLYFDAQQWSSGNTYWRLIGPRGEVRFGEAMSTNVDTLTLSEAGTYLLMVDGHPADAGANQSFGFGIFANPLQSPVRISYLEAQPAPDLVVENVAISTTGGPLQSGATLTVTWQDVNAGTRPALGGWSDRVIIRRADTSEILATAVVTYAPGSAASFAPGAALDRQATLTLPAGNRGAGALRIEIVTDIANAVDEENPLGTAEGNNTAVVPVTSALAPHPDLVVTGISALPAAGWTPGSQVTVTWTTANSGTAPLEANVVERLAVRNTSTNQVVLLETLTFEASAAVPLAGGQTRQRSAVVTWPSGLSSTGVFEFVVTADFTGVASEANEAGTGETNNSATVSILSAPDLRVDGLQVANNGLQAGDTVTIVWQDRNAGNAPTPGGWVDRVRVVNTTTGITLLDTSVAYNQAALGPIAPGASVARTLSFQLPHGLAGAGTLSITVTADQDTNGGTAVTEALQGINAEANNAAVITVGAAQRAYADLRPGNLLAPPTGRGGATIPVSWTVTNAGDADTDVAGWVDQVILSTDEVFGNADDVVLGTYTRTGVLAAKASYSADLVVTLPERLQGTFHLAVRTDAGLAVREPDTRSDNVTSFRGIAISSPYANLVVQSVTAPSPISAGAQVTVGWTVLNGGDSTTSTGSWRDRIYISADGTLNGALLLGTYIRDAAPLGKDATYDGSLSVTLPTNVAGLQHIVVVTDALGEVYEKGLTSDNIGRTLQPIEVQSPDLRVTNVVVPTGALPGRPVTVTWTVQNFGLGNAVGGWSDRVVLVRDGVPGETLLTNVPRTGGLAAGGTYQGRRPSACLPSRTEAGASGSIRTLEMPCSRRGPRRTTAASPMRRSSSPRRTWRFSPSRLPP
jgi:hypothetical protein